MWEDSKSMKNLLAQINENIFHVARGRTAFERRITMLYRERVLFYFTKECTRKCNVVEK